MTNFLHAKYDSEGTQIDDPTAVIGQPEFSVDSTGAVTGLVGPGGKAISIWAKPSPNAVLAKWDVGNCTASVASASDFTYHTTLTVEYAATRFRIALMNANATTCVVGPAKIAVSNAVGADPTIGATTGQARFTPSTGSWTAITWSAASTVTLAARVSATQPSITYSDWIDISTIPRTDGGTLPIVMLRYLVPSSGSTNPYNISGASQHFGQAVAGNANRGSSATTWINGRLHQCIRMTGDGVTTPANFQPTTDFGYCMIQGLEYVSKRPGFTLLGNGDSIMAGAVNSSIGNLGNGWLWQLAALLRTSLPNTPIEVANIGVPSTTTDTFLVRLNTYIAAGGVFDLPFYCAFSPNDGTPTQANTDTAISRAGQAMAACKVANKPFVLVGPCPNTTSAWSAAADAFRLQLRTEVRNSAYAHVTSIDLESIGDGATPVRFAAANTTDGTHPNEVGYGVIAAANASSILALLS